MIFINNALQKIGKECLIINLKANNFFNNESLRKEDFDQLFDILKYDNNNIDLPITNKNNLLLCVLYYEYDTNPEAQKIYKEQFANNYHQKNTGGTKIDLLHLLFNVIEMEIKVKQKTEKELKIIFNDLYSFCNLEKKFEDYLLFKYYSANIKFLLHAYEETNNYTTDLIADIDEHSDLSSKSNIVKYIRIRNVLLKVRTLEMTDPKKNNKDIISHLDCLFSLTKNTKEDFAIGLGIKMLTLQSEEINSFEECIKLIKEMLNILKRETLFGKSHKNILDQYLYISGLLGYYSTLIDDYAEVEKITKKIDKYLVNVQDLIKNSKNLSVNNINNNDNKNKNYYNNLYQQYQFYNVLLKSSINYNSSVKESQHMIQSYKNNSKIKEDDKNLLNMCLLDQEDNRMSSQFKNMEKQFKDCIDKNLDIAKNKLILCYFYLYNQVSNMTKNILNNMNKNNISKNDFQTIRDYVSKIISYTNEQVINKNNQYLKVLFNLPFFKNLFSRLYFVKIYSIYLEGNYKGALKEFEYYNTCKIQYELKTQKNEAFMDKVQGDCYFKLREFEKSESCYNSVISSGVSDPLVYFNLGLCYVYMDKKFKAIEALEKSNELFKKENNPKREIVEKTLDKLKNTK